MRMLINVPSVDEVCVVASVDVVSVDAAVVGVDDADPAVVVCSDVVVDARVDCCSVLEAWEVC